MPSEIKTVKVALVGNPNCGKSSLFNALTGMHQKVGNFPGVTVDKKSGIVKLRKDLHARVIDLPGTYSLYPKRIDEFVTFDVLLNDENESFPDIIVILADASNLKRNLLFCSQIIDLKIPTIIALNMLDVADRNGITIDAEKLAEELGVKVIRINAREGKGVTELKKVLQETIPIPADDFIPNHALSPAVIEEVKNVTKSKSDYAAFQIANHFMNVYCLNAAQKGKIKSILEQNNFNAPKAQSAEIIQRYEKIDFVVARTVVKVDKQKSMLDRTMKYDKILTHPVWGYLIFLSVLFIVFQSIFSWAVYPMNLISDGFTWLSNSLSQSLPDNMFTRLLSEGIIPGIGGVIVFVPQIMLLFGFISILEDTGYMARVSFLLDRIMRKVGLNGKSAVPLMSGVACAIPAIMSTRSIENWKDRIITIMVTPLMSCSARLPVYTLLVSFVVPDQRVFGIVNMKGLAMMSLYLLGFVMALIAAFVMKIIVKAKERSYFLMELPIYRLPRWGNVIATMFNKAKMFVFDAGKIIVAIAVILWFMASYGPSGEMKSIEQQTRMEAKAKNISVKETDQLVQSEKITHSYAGHLGKFIEPVIRPLGFDWKIGISLITCFAAREVFVGTMATIYSVGSDEEKDYDNIRQHMKTETFADNGAKVYSTATVISLLIFFAFAMQCMSTLAVVRRETQSWKWPLIQFIYMTGLAYVSSFIVYQLLK